MLEPKLTDANGFAIWDLMEHLFPIHRTLVSDGYRNSLEIIKKHLDIDVLEHDTGEEHYDWVIPDAWDVNEAYIEDSKGVRIIDFSNSNLHLAAYSVPFQGKISKDELFEHLYWLEDQPDAIPYDYLYYREKWQFCISKNDLKKFTDSEYYVHIDVNKRPGKLLIGEKLIKGKSDKEFIISSYMCHPSVANDALSGVVTGIEVFKKLEELAKKEELNYSYRFLIVPETIGMITWLSTHEDLFDKIQGGYVLTTCGDGGNPSYKKSYPGDALIDRAAIHALDHNTDYPENTIIEYLLAGSDERQFNSPGIRIPFGSLMRTMYEDFPEYHTSKDDMTLVTKEGLLDTARNVLETIFILDNNATYKATYKGEPFLSKHDLHIPFVGYEGDGYVNQIVMHESDGVMDLLSIAEKHNNPFKKILEFSKKFEEKGLLKRL
ncbi:MAG: DUF4910 domain-containing protein [Candidatus Lindowbacteria bacterium]|nr:DUF4910 domain-containing protein [Candidatus Lindowbacteria bacterium]